MRIRSSGRTVFRSKFKPSHALLGLILSSLLIAALTSACATPPTLSFTPRPTLGLTPTLTITPTLGPTRPFMPTSTPQPPSLCAAAQAPLPPDLTLAFVARSSYGSEIFTVQADGSGLRQVTNNFTDDAYPVWAPDGKQFLTLDKANRQLYLMTPGGADRKALLTVPGIESLGAGALLSPDGTRLAMGATVHKHSDFYIFSFSKGDIKNITQGKTYFDLFPVAWSSDSSLILFYEASTLPETGSYFARSYVAQANGPTLLSLDPDGKLDWDQAAGWIDNQNWIVTLSKEYDVFEQVSLVRGDGSNRHQLTNSSTHKSSLAISPDEKYIAYVADFGQDAAGTGGSRYEIRVMNADGSNNRVLLSSDLPVGQLAWAPGSRHIAYEQAQSGTPPPLGGYDLYLLDVCTGSSTLLARNAAYDLGKPVWKP